MARWQTGRARRQALFGVGGLLAALLIAGWWAETATGRSVDGVVPRALAAEQSYSASSDAPVRENQADTNFGSDVTLEVGKVTIGSTSALRYSFVRFGAVSLPAGATFVDAQLEVDLISGTGANPVTVFVCRVEADWAESGPGGITWNNQPYITSLTPCVNGPVSTSPGIKSWDVSSIVSTWLDGSSANYGLRLSPVQDVSALRTFRAREHINPPVAARLIVHYNLPPTVTPTRTRTATRTATPTRTNTATRTNTGSPTSTRTASPSRTFTATSSTTPTQSATPTATSPPTDTPVATDTPVVTDTSTPTPRVGAIVGQVYLERRRSNAGVMVRAGGVQTTTGIDGTFALDGVQAGPQTLAFSHLSYLRQSLAVEVVTGESLVAPSVTLLGGDVDQDGEIDAEDGAAILRAWGAKRGDAAFAEALDITADGWVNLLDLVAVRFNAGHRATGPALAQAATVAAGGRP